MAAAVKPDGFSYNWLPPERAAAVVGLARGTFEHYAGLQTLPRAVDSKPNPHRPNGTVWYREELERVAKIMKRCDLGLEAACRVLLAIEAEGPL